jgi:hypothetical protein
MPITRTTLKTRKIICREKSMDHTAFVNSAEQAAWAEVREAEGRYKEILGEVRKRRTAFLEAKAVWHRLRQIVVTIKETESQEDADAAAKIDPETGAKVANVIVRLLEQDPAGYSVSEMAELMADLAIKKSTISAALYNMKKRNQITHVESTGKYRLPPRTSPRTISHPGRIPR